MSQPEAGLADVGAVIVHYFRDDTLATVVAGVVAAGIPASNVVVVDNGSQPETASTIGRRIPGVSWLGLDNPGYGAAVNAGAEMLSLRCQFVLVLTHEVRVAANLPSALKAKLVATPDLGLVGPVLLDANTPDKMWSEGGVLTKWTCRPGHRGSGSTWPGSRSGLLDCSWVDGACFMFRTPDLHRAGGMNEEYFLYLEDVDLGARFRNRLSMRVAVDLSTWASQSPAGSGIDTFLAVRNQLLYLRAWSGVGCFLLFLAEQWARLILIAILRPAGWRERSKKRRRALTVSYQRIE